MTTPYQAVFVTVPDQITADKITNGLLENKLAACVTTLPGCRSKYRWEGRLETADELLMIIKTRVSLTPDITRFIKENHPYSVPEIVTLPITGGNENYLDWLGASCTFTRNIPKPDNIKI